MESRKTGGQEVAPSDDDDDLTVFARYASHCCFATTKALLISSVSLGLNQSSGAASGKIWPGEWSDEDAPALCRSGS